MEISPSRSTGLTTLKMVASLVVAVLAVHQDVLDVIGVVGQHHGDAQGPEPEQVAVAGDVVCEEVQLVALEGERAPEQIPGASRG